MHSSGLAFIALLITSSVSASFLPSPANLEPRHIQATEIPFAIYLQNNPKVAEQPLTSQRHRFQCGNKSYSGYKVQKALDRGCKVFMKNKQNMKFPQTFTAFQYQGMQSLNEWPLRWTNSFFRMFPGRRRVIFDNTCKLAGVVVRERDGSYKPCMPYAA